MSGEDKTDAWMPLWIGAYLADTLTFTTVQHGAYLLLLMAYWRERAPLPDDDDELAAIAKLSRSEWMKLRPKLARKFKVADGVWWHKRVEHEMAEADRRSKKASEKASRAAQARWGASNKHASGSASSMPGALPEDCPTPSPTPSSLRSDSAPDGAAGAAAPPPPAEPEETLEQRIRREVWSEGRRLLVEKGGATRERAGAYIGELVKDYDVETVLNAVRAAVREVAAEPFAYLKAACARLKGERNTVPSDAAEKTAAYLDAEKARQAAPPPKELLERVRRAVKPAGEQVPAEAGGVEHD